MSELPVSVDRTIEHKAHAATNYAVIGHAVEVRGVCPYCQQAAVTQRESFSTIR